MTEWIYPISGQHVYDGVPMLSYNKPSLLQSIKAFQYKPDDVLVATYPKSGTTWMCELVYLLQNKADTDLARSLPIQRRVPFIDVDFSHNFSSGLDVIDKLPSPRTIKTHLHPHFYETQIKQGQMKVIAVMRNVKDALVSYYHFYQMNRGYEQYKGSWDDFFEIVKSNQLIYGDWFDHVTKWWGMRHYANVHVVTYEDIKKNPRKTLAKLAKFLDKDLDASTTEKILEHTSFESMKNNPTTNGVGSPFLDTSVCSFIRKGEVGDWRNYFSQEQIQYIEHRVNSELLPLGLHFDH